MPPGVVFPQKDGLFRNLARRPFPGAWARSAAANSGPGVTQHTACLCAAQTKNCFSLSNGRKQWKSTGHGKATGNSHLGWLQLLEGTASPVTRMEGLALRRGLLALQPDGQVLHFC